jgi:hypothetical protein
VTAGAAPLAIVLHELGHFLAGKLFAFENTVLHFAHVSTGAALWSFPHWQQAAFWAAGPLISLLIVGACCYATARRGPRSIWVAPAFTAGARTLVMSSIYSLLYLLMPEQRGQAIVHFDELEIAQVLGMPSALVLGPLVVLVLSAWVFLVTRLPRGFRVVPLLAMVVGHVLGTVLYFMLGSLIFP